ncbi:MAG: dTMP kinase [Candidatus Woesearchaeota archaeon]
MTGKLISLEGIDGCGKGTQINLLRNHLTTQQIPHHIFREPGGTDISERIRSLLLHETEYMDSGTELLLFLAARRQLTTEKILPLLEQNELVILDRFYDSTFAYQGFGRGTDIKNITALNDFAITEKQTDATFYLHVSLEASYQRTMHQEKDRMEKESRKFFERVKNGYDTLAKMHPQRIHVIDAEREPQEIHKDLVSRVEALYT